MTSQSPRQLALLTLLASAKKPIDQQKIFERLPGFYTADKGKQNSVIKMFERDLASLCASGAPIVAEEQDDCMVYRVLGAKELLPLDFTLSQAESQGLRDLLQDPLVLAQLPDTAQRTLSNLLCFHAIFDVEARGEKKDRGKAETKISKLAAAAREEKAVTIEYPAHGHDGMQAREISPLGVYFFRGRGYVVGICHRSIRPKTFAVDKIARIKLAREVYLHPEPGFNLESHAGRNTWLLASGDVKEVTLKVGPQEAWRLEEEAGMNLVARGEDGSVTARFCATESEFFYRQVLGFGQHAQILDPPELREGLVRYMEGKSHRAKGKGEKR